MAAIRPHADSAIAKPVIETMPWAARRNELAKSFFGLIIIFLLSLRSRLLRNFSAFAVLARMTKANSLARIKGEPTHGPARRPTPHLYQQRRKGQSAALVRPATAPALLYLPTSLWVVDLTIGDLLATGGSDHFDVTSQEAWLASL